VIKHWAVQKSGQRDTPMQEVVVMVAAMAVKMLMTMPMIVFHNFAFMMFKLFFDVNNIGFPPLFLSRIFQDFFCQEFENLRIIISSYKEFSRFHAKN